MCDNITCISGCCNLATTKYVQSKTINDENKKGKRKSGILLYDEKERCILIVQSRGNLWGIPKGTLEDDENIVDGACREVLEETGINIDKNLLDKYLEIDDKYSYFILNYEKCKVEVQTQIINNDANSIGWVNLDCLKQLITHGKIKLTSHTKITLKTLLDFY